MATQQYDTAPPLNSAAAASPPPPETEQGDGENLIVVLEVMPDGTFKVYSSEETEPQSAPDMDAALELVRGLAGDSEAAEGEGGNGQALWDQMAAARKPPEQEAY